MLALLERLVLSEARCPFAGDGEKRNRMFLPGRLFFSGMVIFLWAKSFFHKDKSMNRTAINRIFALVFPLLFFACARAQSQSPVATQIDGFRYGTEAAPSGREWESPGDLSLNKELPRADFHAFPNVGQARKLLPEHSDRWLSLNGTWKFHWAKTPEERPRDFFDPQKDLSGWDDVPVPMNWNVLGIQKDGSLKYGVPIYVNQQVIFRHSVRPDDWRGGVMRTPPEDWTTYVHRNEVGSYRRDFDLPAGWDGREVFLNFDGVDSFFYLWINGRYVGFSKNSRNVASFNVTPYLNKKGRNTVAVEVYRNSDASFLEAQDMFRLPGIFRAVSLTSRPKVHIRDLVALPNLSPDFRTGTLKMTADLRNLRNKKAKGYAIRYSLYANALYSDENAPAENTKLIARSKDRTAIPKGGSQVVEAELRIDAPNLWSAERPHRYTLVAELLDDGDRTVEAVSTTVGFRKIEIRDTSAEEDEFGQAGRYYYINGKTVKLKGVNRHETDPETGKVISRQQMEEEIMLMKRANINHVRNSHYPDDPYWYYLCDKYGIYLEDEANIESHQYYYGEASLSHPEEWKNAHVARNLEMVHARINHPSIVIWSLGNEAGSGRNFAAAYEAIKKVDKSRPVQYERNNSIVDMGSNQYPSINWVRGAVRGTYRLKYPFHISEYAHSMGNAAGNLVDYWEAIESTNFFMGGAIWDWKDQSIYHYDKRTGERFLAYGGDFGDKPNDGTFVNNGLIFADMVPKPQYYEVKKVYQNVGVKAVDMRRGKIEIHNKNYFTDLSGYQIAWALYEDGVEIQRNQLNYKKSIPPREKQPFDLPYAFEQLKASSEYFVKIQFILTEDKPWAKKGFVQMEEQLAVKEASARPSVAEKAGGKALSRSEETGFYVVDGQNFTVAFDRKTGTIHRLSYSGEQLIGDGKGPKLDALRAPVDNDNWAYKQWFAKGLHNLKHTALSETVYEQPDGTVVLAFVVESQAANGAALNGGTSGRYSLDEHADRPFGPEDFKFTSNQIWTVYRDGSIELQAAVTSSDASLALARLGYAFQMPERYGNYTYYGRGPVNNYADRKTAQFIERHNSTVKEQFVPWPNPQSMSNNEDVRWAALTDDAGNGAVFVAKSPMATSALPWSEMELTLAPHPHELPPSSGTHVHLDAAVTGLGGNSCGQGPPLEPHRVKAAPTVMGFLIRPVNSGDFAEKANVSTGGHAPLSVSRSKNGEVSIAGERTDFAITYQVDESAPRLYQGPFGLRNGGTVRAWYTDDEQLRTSQTFSRIETVPVEVVSVSSEESGGEKASNLVDGDPSTIWHSMYSVTVAQYPHWVDFDMGEAKRIKGFAYLPRQDGGTNGNIKGYRIQVSTDGTDWGDPVAEGEFERGASEKNVQLENPVHGRYIRFTALSSQNGQDFASGASFTVKADSLIDN